MLRINSLKFVNFGSYYGEHKIDFPSDNGVIIVWGENGYGKTTIMQAFRYVLWGKLINRKRQHIPAFNYINTDAILDETVQTMFVEVSMNFNGDNYVVTRGLKFSGGDRNNEFSYSNFFHVLKENTSLSKEDGENLLTSILPERISRFYLFDGELLNEYEDLLDNTLTSGEEIKRSIEDILGMPLLEGARDKLISIEGKYTSEAASIAKKQTETKNISDMIEANNEDLEHHLKSRAELQEELEKFNGELEDIKDKMQKSADLRELLSKKEQLEQQLQEKSDKLEQLKEKVVSEADNAWSFLLHSILASLINDIKETIKPLEEKQNKAEAYQNVSSFVLNALENDGETCPICDDAITLSKKNELIKKFSEVGIVLSTDEKAVLDSAQSNIKFLNDISISDNHELYLHILSEYEDTSTDIDLLRVDIKNISDDINNVNLDGDADEIKQLPQQLTNTTLKINEIKERLEENHNEIEDLRAAIAKLRESLRKKSSNADVNIALQRQNLAEELRQLFEAGISSFRETLKKEVEKDASNIFNEISHEAGYDHLEINDNFGLEIITEDNRIVPNRSSGFEQVVAISLIFALHHNAPIAGPIFMDSTFQRIDKKHKLKLAKILHTLADQVIVLIYEDEIAPSKDETRSLFSGNLVKEIEIEKESKCKSSFKA